jgi:hypothetical protein
MDTEKSQANITIVYTEVAAVSVLAVPEYSHMNTTSVCCCVSYYITLRTQVFMCAETGIKET